MNPRVLQRTQALQVRTFGVAGQNVYTTGGQLTLGPLPYLLGKQVTGLVYQAGPGQTAENWMLTLKNKKGEILLFRYPCSDILTTQTKPRLFNLFNIDAQSSYLEEFTDTPHSFQPGVLIGTITFQTNYGNGTNS
ncbi:MAG: hypothetical protein [Bacteriophage sp.]|nr:MAG: hypothetical protein [Bacteriophage sp.]